ncbi:hypothetical protein R3P38DRAFT_3262867 [Favolaschia claudopus]|uniref:Uncharacterized protein n=1 Tax=Favolaschia claudopus TaxID=2862362 RepID=A0AAW0CG82_9AGAR
MDPEKIPPHPFERRRRVSTVSFILLALTALFLIWLGTPIASNLLYINSTRFPPRELFVNETDITLVANRSDVVQPLVGLNDTFDIAVTVWQPTFWEEKRLARYEESTEEYPPLGEEQKSLFFGPNATEEEEAEAARKSRAYLSWYKSVSSHEKTIFSDIVFRGVRLSDTDLHANVSFQIPTQIYHEHPGNNYDLRASFVIIPRSPSLLDYYRNYTSWFPDAVNRPRFKSLPFPLKFPTQFHRRPHDEALDAFAITIPLLERHPVPSRCLLAEGDYRLWLDPEREEYLRKHPHVVTRTHLRVVREHRIFHLDRFTQMQERLRNISCGALRPDHRISLNHCHKSFGRNGNWEVLLKLAVPDDDSDSNTEGEGKGGFHEESAYAPYMDVLHDVAGPKDVIPVPINREWWCKSPELGNFDNSSSSLSSENDPDSEAEAEIMNITWRLSYSGVSPMRFLLGDMQWTPPQRSSYNESEFEKAMKHDLAETYGSIHGYRHNTDTYPLRRLLRLFLSLLSFLALLLLNCIYYANRTTTTVISVPGLLFILSGDLISVTAAIHRFLVSPAAMDGSESARLFLSLMFNQIPQPLCMLKLLLRLQLVRQGFLRFTLRRTPVSHQERASARLDSRTGWVGKFGIFAFILAIDYTLNLHGRYLVSPAIPSLGPGDLPDLLPSELTSAVDALRLTGWILQMILNFRSRVFAGSYKIAVVLSVVVELLGHAAAATWLVGRSEIITGVSYWEGLRGVLLGVNCWQAWRYESRVPEDLHGDDDE